MNRRLLLCLPALGLGLGAALADRLPDASPQDRRVGLLDYTAQDVFTIPVARGIVTRIVLGADERIVKRFVATGFPAACGDAQGQEWCITAEDGDNQIWVKPLRGATSNNLELRTTRRDYSFNFVVAPGAERAASAFYRVVVRPPAPPPELPPLATRQDTAPTAIAPVASATRPPHDYPRPAVRNYAYTRRGAPDTEALAPAVVFDDGRFTYLRFPRGQEVPAVFAIAPDGEEIRVATHAERLAPDPAAPQAEAERDYLVVHRVARRLVLRLGAAVIELVNERPDLEGLETPNGTTDARFVRESRP